MTPLVSECLVATFLSVDSSTAISNMNTELLWSEQSNLRCRPALPVSCFHARVVTEDGRPRPSNLQYAHDKRRSLHFLCLHVEIFAADPLVAISSGSAEA